jgi:tripartite-type tricarboxylate transporter receptor subunit TctC
MPASGIRCLPAGTSRIIDRPNRETIAVLNKPEFTKLLGERDRPDRQHAEELAQYIKNEIDKWAKVVKEEDTPE